MNTADHWVAAPTPGQVCALSLRAAASQRINDGRHLVLLIRKKRDMRFLILYLTRILAGVALIMANVGVTKAQVPPPQKISIPIVKVTPETIKQRETADAAAKVAAAAAAAKRAKEVSESVEQARKRIQLIPISAIDGLNVITAAQTNERAMVNEGQPANFCTWSQNELAATSVKQINGMSQQAALNLEYCMLVGYKEERNRARRQYNDPVISTFGFGALEPTMIAPESSALKKRLDKECPLRGTTSHCVDFCADGRSQSRCVMGR